MLNNVNDQSFFFFSLPLFSGLFSSHHQGKNAAHFHILSAICSFLSEASQMFLTHRKHIEIDSACFCVYMHACVCVSDFLQNDFLFLIVFFVRAFFYIYLIRLLLKTILQLYTYCHHAVLLSATGRIHLPLTVY